MSDILVTGAAGFAGGYIANYLQKKGYSVYGVIRKKLHGVTYSFPVIEHDLSLPFPTCHRFSAIVHAAGAHPGSKVEVLKKNNIDSMENLVCFAKKTGVSRMIYLSSISIYGSVQEEIIDENTDIINPDAYGLSKHMAELILQDEKNMEGTCLRLPGIWGNGAKYGWLVNAEKKISAGEDVTIYAPNFMSNNFVSVDDLAKFTFLLLQKKQIHFTYLLGTDEKISIENCVRLIKTITGSSSQIRIGDAKRQSFSLDISRALSDGYCPVSPEMMIKKYFGVA